jgi:hypothetical protein
MVSLDGEVISMPTFLAAPHVRHAAARLRTLRANPDASAARRYLGEEGAREYLSGIDQPGTRMA